MPDGRGGTPAADHAAADVRDPGTWTSPGLRVPYRRLDSGRSDPRQRRRTIAQTLPRIEGPYGENLQLFDVILLDIGLPGISGLDVLAEVKRLDAPPRVVMITADDTSETLLKAVRGQADRYVTKPFAPGTIVEVVDDVLAEPAAAEFPIQVVSAKAEWVELVAPCTLRVSNRIQGFMKGLEADLPESIRDSIGQAFRELLSNAVEWGGHLDPERMVRISCIRAKRMLLYRIA